MKYTTLDLDLDTADADGLAAANDSSGSTLTLDGVLTSGGTYTSVDGLAHQLSITDTATIDQSGATFTVTGTDASDHVQTEAITGPGSGATVTSSKYFKTVTSVAIASGAGSGTVNMGTTASGVAVSRIIPLDHYSTEPATVQVTVTGTINFDVEVSLEDPYGITDDEDIDWLNDANFTGKTASLMAALGVAGVRSMRVQINSYSAGAELQVYIASPK